jgi:hypothetical protein
MDLLGSKSQQQQLPPQAQFAYSTVVYPPAPTIPANPLIRGYSVKFDIVSPPKAGSSGSGASTQTVIATGSGSPKTPTSLKRIRPDPDTIRTMRGSKVRRTLFDETVKGFGTSTPLPEPQSSFELPLEKPGPRKSKVLPDLSVMSDFEKNKDPEPEIEEEKAQEKPEIEPEDPKLDELAPETVPGKGLGN